MVKAYLTRLRKRRHVQRKIRMSEQKMWDLEFLRDKLKAMKEGFRMERDRLMEMVDASNLRLEAENKKEDPDKTIKDNLERLKEKYEPDIKQLETQMDAIEGQITGAQGVEEGIDGYRTVIGLLKEHKEKI